MIATPATSGGAKLNANFLAGTENKGVFEIFDFCHMASKPIANARQASVSQTISQSREVNLLCGNVGRADRGRAHKHPAVTGHGGEVRGALHRLADEFEIVGGPVADADRLALRGFVLLERL